MHAIHNTIFINYSIITGCLEMKRRTEDPNWKFMLQEYKFMLQESHKLEVYATRTAQTGSLCYKNRTNWKFMLQESPKLEVYATRTATRTAHKLEVYATRKRHFQLEMV